MKRKKEDDIWDQGGWREKEQRKDDNRVPQVRERKEKGTQEESRGAWPAAMANNGDEQNRFLRRRGTLGWQQLDKGGGETAAAAKAAEGSSRARSGDDGAMAPREKGGEYDDGEGTGNSTEQTR